MTLIDLENGTGSCAEEGTAGTNASVRGTVPHGKYIGVRYTIGVPFELNHTDAPAAPAPLNSAAMAWSWQGGRKFTKIEVTDPGGATGTWSAKTFFVHLGSAGCTGNPATGQTVECRYANRSSVRLKRFDSSKQQIAVDLKALLAGNDITANRADAPGCMSGPTDPECAGVFGSFGHRLASRRQRQRRLSGTNAQTVFRAIRDETGCCAVAAGRSAAPRAMGLVTARSRLQRRGRARGPAAGLGAAEGASRSRASPRTTR